MSTLAQLSVELRKGTGKGAARALRREHKIPAIIYGGGKAEITIALPEKELTQEYQRGYFTSRVYDMNVAGEKIHAIPRDVQLHPVTSAIEHVDFQRVHPHEKVRVFIPVRFLNTDRCIGIKRGGALNIVRRSIEFLCDVDAVPEKIEVDVLDVNIGHTVHVSSIKLPAGVSPVIDDRDFTIASIVGRGKDDDTAATADAAAAAAPAAAAADPKKAGDAKKAPEKKAPEKKK